MDIGIIKKSLHFIKDHIAGLAHTVPPLTWNEISRQSAIRLYAGDIPPMSMYEGLVGLSLTRNDATHIRHDIRKPFPLPDNSVLSFQAEDVFEHIRYDELLPIINEVFRILRRGGCFRLSLPDYGCDVLYDRSIRDSGDNIIFDPGGGGTPEKPGHLWFPRIESVQRLVEASDFAECGTIVFLHYYNMDGSFVVNRIDYSKGHVQRTPDFDKRVQKPCRPFSMVIDMTKN